MCFSFFGSADTFTSINYVKRLKRQYLDPSILAILSAQCALCHVVGGEEASQIWALEDGVSFKLIRGAKTTRKAGTDVKLVALGRESFSARTM